MHTNDANNTNKLIYPELSYTLTGLFFDIQNTLGRYAKEKQYGDEIERRLQKLKIPYKRELVISDSGNRVDFLIEDKLAIEVKAKRITGREDYYQMQRYLQSMDVKLGLLVNFRSQYLKPKRIVRIETDLKNKFV